jgi:hypothetical protein
MAWAMAYCATTVLPADGGGAWGLVMVKGERRKKLKGQERGEEEKERE